MIQTPLSAARRNEMHPRTQPSPFPHLSFALFFLQLFVTTFFAVTTRYKPQHGHPNDKRSAYEARLRFTKLLKFFRISSRVPKRRSGAFVGCLVGEGCQEFWAEHIGFRHTVVLRSSVSTESHSRPNFQNEVTKATLYHSEEMPSV